MRVPKSEQPETLTQARRWENRRRLYATLGWCAKCASQAAWGHQIGFTKIHPPCQQCAGLPTQTGYEHAQKWSTQ